MKAYVIGGSGYTGRETLRLLESHPKTDEIRVSSTRYAREKVASIHPDLETKLVFEEYSANEANKSDIAFSCVPHTKSMNVLKGVESRIVDLSADFRLKDVEVYEKSYGVSHECPKLVSDAVYGLPEYYRDDIKNARIIANPGCYPTAAILACKPLIENFDVSALIVDSKSGVSGAGRGKEDEMQKFVGDENLKAYKIVGHQHTPEMEQELGVKVSFTPHLAPLNRGIFTTVHAISSVDPDDVLAAYEKKYESEPFVELVDEPELSSVVNTNKCQIGGFRSDGQRLVITAAIDNLIKGASGQAVQNMNIMLGFEETAGL